MTGEVLLNKIKGKGYSVTSAAKVLGISRQTLHTHLGRAKLDEDFLQTVKTKLRVDISDAIPFYRTQEDFIREAKEELTALKATVKVLTFKLIGLESKTSKVPVEKVALELGEMIDKEVKRLLDVLRSES